MPKQRYVGCVCMPVLTENDDQEDTNVAEQENAAEGESVGA
jgi:hypothetical protein